MNVGGYHSPAAPDREINTWSAGDGAVKSALSAAPKPLVCSRDGDDTMSCLWQCPLQSYIGYLPRSDQAPGQYANAFGQGTRRLVAWPSVSAKPLQSTHRAKQYVKHRRSSIRSLYIRHA